MADPKICAIIGVRNEARYLPNLIRHLKSQGLEIAVVDNGSTDGSRELFEAERGGHLVAMRDLPWTGAFSLSAQLQAKAEVELRLKHDWILHLDADEIMHSREPGLRLVDVAQQATEDGCNVVNFEEFVFLPEPDHDGSQEGAHRHILRYYYFAPRRPRLMRLYRRGQGLDNRAGGGHSVKGNPIIFGEDQVLRHYIALDQEHVTSKYLNRVFEDKELTRGWHKNRVGLTEEQLDLAAIPRDDLEYLTDYDSRKMNRSRPRMGHFWHWPR
ncbi:MAG: glycosyltransferase family 2 protein [Methylobacteriaceae bacterium]